jgi:hypothetical protein
MEGDRKDEGKNEQNKWKRRVIRNKEDKQKMRTELEKKEGPEGIRKEKWRTGKRKINKEAKGD